MTDLEKDTLRIMLGAGDAVIARRERELAGFEAEHKKCLNPFRKELLCSEIKRQRRELEGLRDLLSSQTEAPAALCEATQGAQQMPHRKPGVE